MSDFFEKNCEILSKYTLICFYLYLKFAFHFRCLPTVLFIFVDISFLGYNAIIWWFEIGNQFTQIAFELAGHAFYFFTKLNFIVTMFVLCSAENCQN